VWLDNTATYLCKKYNLLRKSDRILVYEALRGVDVKMYIWQDEIPELTRLLNSFSGPYRIPLIKTYRAKHGLNDQQEGN
jgi:hypothetical protein